MACGWVAFVEAPEALTLHYQLRRSCRRYFIQVLLNILAFIEVYPSGLKCLFTNVAMDLL